MHRELVQWIADHSGQSHDQSGDGLAIHHPPEEAPSDSNSGERVILINRPQPTSMVTNLMEIVHDV